jgi:protein required for attachment to host cells
MKSLRIKNGEWVVVCDGAKALIFENIGDTDIPNFKTREVHEHADAKTHELGTDAPGRSFNSVGNARSSVEQTDWHDQAEREFLTRLAQRLEKAVEAGEMKSLIVVAPPRALGMLREAYPGQLKPAIREEVAKDYVKMPVDQIEKHLTA